MSGAARARRRQDHQRFGAQRRQDERGRSRRVGHDREVEPARQQRVQQLRAEPLHNFQGDGRTLLARPRHAARQQQRRKRRRSAHHHGPAGRLRLAANVLAGPRHFEHDRARVVQEVPPRSRQADPSRQTHEKLRAELRLELLDVPGQCRLRDADLVRGTRDASFIGDLHEILDAAQFHGPESLSARMTQR